MSIDSSFKLCEESFLGLLISTLLYLIEIKYKLMLELQLYCTTERRKLQLIISLQKKQDKHSLQITPYMVACLIRYLNMALSTFVHLLYLSFYEWFIYLEYLEELSISLNYFLDYITNK